VATLQQGASYVHRRPHPEGWADRLRSVVGADPNWSANASKVWQLLDTPQTVKSLCRALSPDELPDPHCHGGVEAVLGRLLSQDLIELSEDT
jgi:hypothetical protein